MDHSHSLLLVLFGAVYLGANPVESFGETHMVPMRDGIRLQTVITMPLNPPGSKCAVVMDRSPYGKDFLELLSMLFLGEGFASIRQDMRGTKGSEGNFTTWRSAGNECLHTCLHTFLYVCTHVYPRAHTHTRARARAHTQVTTQQTPSSGFARWTGSTAECMLTCPIECSIDCSIDCLIGIQSAFPPTRSVSTCSECRARPHGFAVSGSCSARPSSTTWCTPAEPSEVMQHAPCDTT